MVLFICNSFLPQLGYLMPATSASLIMFCLYHCALAPVDFRHFKSQGYVNSTCSQNVTLIPDICQFWATTALFNPVKVFQIVRNFATKKQIGQNRAKFRLFKTLSHFGSPVRVALF